MARRRLWMGSQAAEVAQEAHTEPSAAPESVSITSPPAATASRRDQRQRKRQRTYGTIASFYTMACAACSAFQCGLFSLGVHSFTDCDCFAFHAALSKTQERQGRDGVDFFAEDVQGPQREVQFARRRQSCPHIGRSNLAKRGCKIPQAAGGSFESCSQKLADLDEQWEAYRVQWAAYIDKASQMWLSHVESFEHGEGKFAEKRQEALQHLQQTRARLHEIHMRTMEEGSSLEGAQVENAQEALDATMKLDEQDGSEVESNFTQLKADLTGVVKQVKDTIEEKLSKRRRLTPPRPADLEDVEVVEPGDKRTRDSN